MFISGRAIASLGGTVVDTADALPLRPQVPFSLRFRGFCMCVRIRFTSRTGLPIYDGTGLITLPASLSASHRVTAVRAVLSELHVVQPELGAVCWCGEPVPMLPAVPRQRRSEQVMSHGA